MTTFKYDQILDSIWGAALMAGGGGGSLQYGLDLLESYMHVHTLEPEDVSITVIDPHGIPAENYAGVTAGIGAPTAIQGDFSPYVKNAFALLQSLAAQATPPRAITYSMAVELGGFNTFIPMLVALAQGIPLVDADGSGRAVPALNTTLLAVNGNNASPIGLVDNNNNQVILALQDPKDAQLAETLARQVAVGFGNICGLSGWMIHKDALINTVATGSISLCQKIGAVLRDSSITDKFGELKQRGIVSCRKVCSATISAGASKEQDGFDRGFVEYTANGTSYKTVFQNETLLIQSAGEVLMTAPDIIACYDQQSGRPLTNADLFDAQGKVKQGLPPVALGLIAVDQQWWNQDYEVINALWQEYFKPDYNGDIKRFTDTDVACV
ncbi:MAG: DUF917 domain-containing protein [Treponema sp.]|jgi:DUF917 family protein|nr:DUF917 domain-containing protein [Treponema sp.]